MKISMIIGSLSIALALGACGDDDDDTGLDPGTDADTDADADGDSDTDGDTDYACDGDCNPQEWVHTPCTCAPEDPCNWSGDGFCDSACVDNGIVDEMFDDTADCVADCPDNVWDDVWTYGESYAPGPYGFKGSMCRAGGANGDWIEHGDTIPDVCLPDENDVEVCLSDYFGGETDLLIVDFTAMWCPPCNALADDEGDFIAAIEEAGYSVEFISVLEENAQYEVPSAANAATWKTSKGLEGVVLYDADQTWLNDVMSDKWPSESDRGYPMWFLISTSNMLIWDEMAGWDTTVIAWMTDTMLPIYSTSPGAFDADTDADTDSDTDTDTDTDTDADTDTDTDTDTDSDTDTGTDTTT
jgi:hypothetical protein